VCGKIYDFPSDCETKQNIINRLTDTA